MFIKLHHLTRRFKPFVKGNHPGVYYTDDLNAEIYIKTWTNYNILDGYRASSRDTFSVTEDHAYGPGYRSGYGLADNEEQVLERYKHLADRKEQFVIFMTPMYRKFESSWGGFRFHKWGEYIGTHDLTCEYLYDQTDIDVIYVYHVHQIDGTRARPSRVGNRIKKMNVKKKMEAFRLEHFSKRSKPRDVSHTTYLKKKGR